MTITDIEQALTSAMKAKDQATVETLRGLKTRIQNEQIAKMHEISSDEILSLIRSEIKRRKEAAEAFRIGGRAELAEKELAESQILAKYVPVGPSEEQVTSEVKAIIAAGGFTAAQFGQVMAQAKQKFGNQIDGALLAGIVKQELAG